jgi:hypothetical protein
MPRCREHTRKGKRGVGLPWYTDAGRYGFRESRSGSQYREEIIEWFDLTREQVTAVLDFAARSLETPAHR